jgi:hypothetical protein
MLTVQALYPAVVGEQDAKFRSLELEACEHLIGQDPHRTGAQFARARRAP